MEAIKQLEKEFKPMETATAPKAESEFIQLPDPAKGENEIIILTPEIYLNLIYNGEELPEQAQKYISSSIEYQITDYFHYNNLELIDSDLKVYLTSNYRRENFQDNLKIECIPDYNPLLERLPADEAYYFNCEPAYYRTVESEALDFLTYHIMEEYLESEFKTNISKLDILRVLRTEDKDHQKIYRQADTVELLEDIQTAFKKLTSEILEEAQEELQEKYYEELYYPCQEYAEQELLEELPKALKDL